MSDINQTLNFSREFRKIRKYHKNPSIRSRFVPYGNTDDQTDRKTDRYDEAISRFSQFCKRT